MTRSDKHMSQEPTDRRRVEPGKLDSPARSWFDKLEQQLKEQFALAGDLAHGATIGSVRETLLTIALKSILPSEVHVGSGIIVDEHGKRSRQVDIIVYDPRFPKLEVVDGLGTYFVEGVIAAIEVKSKLDRRNLRDALENSRSVLDLAYFADMDQVRARADSVAESRQISKQQALELILAEVLPSTYVFGFTGYKRHKALMEAVHDWYFEEDKPGHRDFPHLPKAILTERSVGITNDLWLSLNPIESSIDEGEYDPDALCVMTFFQADYRFGILVTHVLHAVSARLGRLHAHQKISMGRNYNDLIRSYLEEIRARQPGSFYWIVRE